MAGYALMWARTALATAEAERAHYEALWVQACAERDHAIANLVQAHDRWAAEEARAEAAEQRATRLTALEAAARAWVGSRGLPFEAEATLVLAEAVESLDKENGSPPQSEESRP